MGLIAAILALIALICESFECELVLERSSDRLFVGQRLLRFCRKFVPAHRDRLGSASESITNDGVVLVSDEQDPDRWLMLLGDPEAIVDERNIEPDLPSITRLELADLELDHNVAQLFHVEER